MMSYVMEVSIRPHSSRTGVRVRANDVHLTATATDLRSMQIYLQDLMTDLARELAQVEAAMGGTVDEAG